MKIIIVFGAQSDEAVYRPLIQELEREHRVTSAVVSAHRNPEELRQLLKEEDYDVVVAGAGLSAHLPGVAASLTYKPVIGIPVKAAFAGLDAICSIWQMPYGVPVLMNMPDHLSQLGAWLDVWERLSQKAPLLSAGVRLVDREFSWEAEGLLKERRQTAELAEILGIALEWEAEVCREKANIALVTREEEIVTEGLTINVPLLSKREIQAPETILKLHSWFQRGGLWMGANNLKNALLFLTEMDPQGHDRLAKLQGVRKKTLNLQSK